MKMIKRYYVRFADSKKSKQVTFEEYCTIRRMAVFYNAIITDNFGVECKSLKVSFTEHFV